MRARRFRIRFVVSLGLLPATAHAHGIPVWMFVAALSPLLVLPLIAVLGWLSRSPRVGILHTLFLIGWVLVFWLASNHSKATLFGVGTDYVIWASLVLYAVHTVFIVVLVLRCIFKRIIEKRVVT